MRKQLTRLYQFIFYKLIFSLLKCLPSDNSKIIYIAHYGKNFNCNPKSMFEYIYEHYPQYKNIIVLNHRDRYFDVDKERVKFVSYYSLAFLYHLATSRYWVVNTNLHHYLKPKRGTKYFQTWHAAGAFKKFGLDLPDTMWKEKLSWKEDASHWSMLLCSSKHVVDIYAQACAIDKSKIYPIGLPRNDVFARPKVEKSQILEKYKLPSDKKIILYAPTYRDHKQEDPVNLDFSQLQKQLSDEYVFLLKLHPFLADYQINNDKTNRFVINLSKCDDIQELLLITDVLITDYSSVIFDFALTGRPMIFYAYDLDDYKRGFYVNYEHFVPGPIAYDQEQLMELLKDYDQLYHQYQRKIFEFAEKYNANVGCATEKAVKLLLDEAQDKVEKGGY
jgi:CDP-glycerol glycerophosphotransferase (TagB/SpsB family)